MFAVNALRAACRSGCAQALDFGHAHGRGRGLRRQLSKLSCGGWLPHDRGFVLGCLGLGASVGEPAHNSARGFPTALPPQPWALFEQALR